MENENEIMILIEEKKREEERYIGEKRERVTNLELLKCHYGPYTLTISITRRIEVLS